MHRPGVKVDWWRVRGRTHAPVGDAAAGRVRISGSFTAGDTSAFIEGVTGVFPVQVRDENGRKVLVSKGR